MIFFSAVDELCPPGSACHRALAGSISQFRPRWLLYLCIAFGALFLLMLVINIFLCSAMTCSCVADDGEAAAEAEEGIGGGRKKVEEFDPYTRSWHGSQYGSR